MMISKWFQAHFYVSHLTSRSNLFNNNVVQNLSGITYKVRGFDEEIYRVHQDAHKESPESLLVFKATWKIVRKKINLKLGGRFTAEKIPASIKLAWSLRVQEYNGDFTPKVGTTVVRFPFTGMVGTFSYSIKDMLPLRYRFHHVYRLIHSQRPQFSANWRMKSRPRQM